jgi:hypothetical protein
VAAATAPITARPSVLGMANEALQGASDLTCLQWQFLICRSRARRGWWGLLYDERRLGLRRRCCRHESSFRGLAG